MIVKSTPQCRKSMHFCSNRHQSSDTLVCSAWTVWVTHCVMWQWTLTLKLICLFALFAQGMTGFTCISSTVDMWTKTPVVRTLMAVGRRRAETEIISGKSRRSKQQSSINRQFISNRSTILLDGLTHDSHLFSNHHFWNSISSILSFTKLSSTFICHHFSLVVFVFLFLFFIICWQ